jgi:galactokinase
MDWREAARGIGLSDGESARKAALFSRAMDALDVDRDQLANAHWVPGRVEFLGKHTDYAGGRSLLCAVERGICIVSRRRADAQVRLHAADTGESAELALDARSRGAATVGWATYAATVTRRLARNFGGDLVGADVVFASDLPIAAGMSSSSALVVAVFMSLAAINRLSDRREYRRNIHSMENLAEYLGCLEAGFDYRGLAGEAGVGTLSGCEDQTAMLCAQSGAFVQYAFCPVRFEQRLSFPPNCLLAIASSGLRAEKAGGAMEKYNALSRQARSIARIWRGATGRSDETIADAIASSPEAADELRQHLTAQHGDAVFSSEELVQRLEQFIGESDIIIPAAADAIARGDLSALRLLVERSVDGAERLLRNQVPETLALTGSARDLGAVAASPFGAGFGGSVWALVQEQAPEFLAAWRAAYVKRFPERASTCEFFLTQPGPPACRVDVSDRGAHD